jgi:hypothetical protein
MTPHSGSRRRFAWAALFAVAALCAGAALGCEKRPEPKPVTARFGVFFGGQVQEREELPLILDRARQSIGIRLEFAEAPAAAEEVSWELEKPGTGKDAGPGLVDYGTAKTRPGETTLDIPLSFRAGDRVGNWRVRVTLGKQELLDRGFRVIAPVAPPAPEE